MATYQVKEISDKIIWEKFLLSRNPGTFLQSWDWGESNAQVGFKIKRFGFYKLNNLVAVVQLIHQPAKRGPHFLIPGGPVCDFKNLRLTKFIVKFLHNYGKKEKVWFIRVRPDVPDSESLRNLFNKLGFISAPMHLHGENTLILNISYPEDKILSGMRKTTRYLIKKSFGEGYKIRTSIDKIDAEILYSLQAETVKRHKFIGFNKKLFEAQIETFGKDEQALLFICEKNKVPLVAAIIIFYGKKAFYHHSGSAEVARNTNASYYTQWAIIKKAKSLGSQYYDFWGIAPTDNPKHRFAGVTIFKKGFNGERVDWLHAHDLPISPLYWLTYIFERGRKLIRHL
jgi:peptidoglycan pentaglycine glycine transferase (the first glycine)